MGSIDTGRQLYRKARNRLRRPYTDVASDVTATGYSDSGLIGGTTYYYVLSAVNAYGESADSVEVSVTPATLQPLAIGLENSAHTPVRLMNLQRRSASTWASVIRWPLPFHMKAAAR